MPLLPTLSHASLNQQTVLLRLDLDVPLDHGRVGDSTRLKLSLADIAFCLKRARKILLIGYLGRPRSASDIKFSLKPVQNELKRLIHQDIPLITTLDGVEEWSKTSSPLALLENLRFWPGENANDPKFAQKIAHFAQVFVFDAFAVAHRDVVSTTGLARLLPTYFGSQFTHELKALDHALSTSHHPLMLVLGGAKPDKLELIHKLLDSVDNLLLGGALVKHLPAQLHHHSKLTLAQLTPDGLDITPESAAHFATLLSTAQTIIVNGPLGKFEDPSCLHGTQVVYQSIAASSAYTLAGGGDTEAALSQLGLSHNISHISTGGGALLYYLAHHTFPLLELL